MSIGDPYHSRRAHADTSVSATLAPMFWENSDYSDIYLDGVISVVDGVFGLQVHACGFVIQPASNAFFSNSSATLHLKPLGCPADKSPVQMSSS